jgi:hypothetical protein
LGSNDLKDAGVVETDDGPTAPERGGRLADAFGAFEADGR